MTYVNLNNLEVIHLQIYQVPDAEPLKFPVPSGITGVSSPDYAYMGTDYDTGVLVRKGLQFNDAGIEVVFEFKILLITQVELIWDLWEVCDCWLPFMFVNTSLDAYFPEPVLKNIIQEKKSIDDTWQTNVWWKFIEPPTFRQILNLKPKPELYNCELTLKSQIS